MDVTSEEIRSSRFQGTRHVYDRREVDAFLHRAASTLEIYERKLTVTESHVENLEKALELAQSRARSMNGLDSRIAELEAALAASQHNYESAMSELEARGELEPNKHNLATTEHELQVKIAAADALKDDAARAAEVAESEAVATAESVISASRTEAEEILRTALLAQTSILEEVEQMRLSAEEEVAAKLEELRSGANGPATEDGAAEVEPGTAVATAAADKARKSASKAKAQLKKANKRATVAEDKATEAERELDSVRSELATMVEARQSEVTEESEEVEGLRRQVAQMRTALTNIQERFSGAAKLSPEELELATALVDLDLHDVDLLVDLTTPSMTEPDETGREPAAAAETAPEPEMPRVEIKSKWAQAESVPSGALTEGRSEVDAGRRVWPEVEQTAPNWRDSFGSARRDAAKKAAEAQEEQPLGFYERRLAGLRDRIRDAGVETDN